MQDGDMELGDGCFNCGNIQDHTKKAPVALKESVLNGKTKLCLRKKDGCSKASPTDAEKREGARHKEAFEKKNASSSKAKTSLAAISSYCTVPPCFHECRVCAAISHHSHLHHHQLCIKVATTNMSKHV